MSDKLIYPNNSTHSDHALFKQIETQVHSLDVNMGRTPDAASERMTASLYSHLKNHQEESGMHQVDHVVLSAANDKVRAGEYVIMVQGALNDPANRLLAIKTVDAVNQTVDASFRSLDGLSRHEDMVRAQQQNEQMQQDQRQDQTTQPAHPPHALR